MARHPDHAALNDEHIIPLLNDTTRDIARPGHVTHHGARLEMLGPDKRFDGTGHRQDNVGPLQRLQAVAAPHPCPCRRCSLQPILDLLSHLFQPLPLPADEDQFGHVPRQEPGAGPPCGAVGTDHGCRRLGWIEIHTSRRFQDSLHRHGHGVAVARRHRDGQLLGHGSARIPHHGGKGTQAQDAGAKALGQPPRLHQLAVSRGQRDL